MIGIFTLYTSSGDMIWDVDSGVQQLKRVLARFSNIPYICNTNLAFLQTSYLLYILWYLVKMYLKKRILQIYQAKKKS